MVISILNLSLEQRKQQLSNQATKAVAIVLFVRSNTCVISRPGELEWLLTLRVTSVRPESSPAGRGVARGERSYWSGDIVLLF